ncbi:MAG: alpha/beta hydrolase [Terracidiphilus sp.]|nr:alpha/beta hydrolase [Terracidiphilus sp.]MDR3796729.1 alpha/beta hydrolase [Terracidiphilus sp.]
MYFLSTRALPIGGGVGPLKVLDETNAVHPFSDVASAVRGHDVLLVTHGFNVNQMDGLQGLSNWAKLLNLGNAVCVGMLWPGDARWIHVVDYPVEGNEAMSAGNALASFINTNFSGALSLSFASHSLGARVVLQTIAGLSRSVRGLLLMAGAIDNTALSSEYAAAASKVQSISLLASHSDDVLKWAFPAGNFVSGLFSRGVPYIHEAMGREGPAEPYPSPDNIHADWQIPDGWNFGHGSYLPSSPLGAAPVQYAPLPCFPPPDMPAPPPIAPAALAGNASLWQPGFSAAVQTSRWR